MLHGTLITRCCCPCWSIGGGVCRRQESKDTKQFALFLLHVLCKDRICVCRKELKHDESLLFQSIRRSWSSLDLPGRTVLHQTPQQESRNPSTCSPRQCRAASRPLSGLEGDARNPGETSSKTSIVSLSHEVWWIQAEGIAPPVRYRRKNYFCVLCHSPFRSGFGLGDS